MILKTKIDIYIILKKKKIKLFYREKNKIVCV